MDRTDAMLGRHGGLPPGAAAVITGEEMDDALGRCALCGGRLGPDDDTVHARVRDCEASHAAR